jgi:hypothetical protein
MTNDGGAPFLKNRGVSAFKRGGFGSWRRISGSGRTARIARGILSPALLLRERISEKSRIESLNRSAALLKATRSTFKLAAAGLRHSCSPVRRELSCVFGSLNAILRML